MILLMCNLSCCMSIGIEILRLYLLTKDESNFLFEISCIHLWENDSFMENRWSLRAFPVQKSSKDHRKNSRDKSKNKKIPSINRIDSVNRLYLKKKI